MTHPMMILIAGPYRSGTGDDPAKMAANLARLEAAAYPLFALGHVPMIGEWAALPILRGAGGGMPGSDTYDAVMHPTAHRLLAKCDGVLRLPGASPQAPVGVAYVMGRNHRHAQLAAVADALLQTPAEWPVLEQRLLRPSIRVRLQRCLLLNQLTLQLMVLLQQLMYCCVECQN